MINIFIQNFIGNGVARTAIPIFFITSGFFFFKKFEYSSYFILLKKRFHTLVIPYFFWSFIVICIFYLLQSCEYTKSFFIRRLIADLSNYELLKALIVEPKNYPLWFLRDLIILIIISPMIYFFLKKIRHIYLLFLMFLWLFFYPEVNTALDLYKPNIILFFSIGGYLALYRDELLMFKIGNKTFYILFVTYIAILFLAIITTIAHQNVTPSIFEVVLHKLIILLGIVTIWFLLDRIKVLNVFSITNFTFLIYVFHEPLLTIYKKALLFISGKDALMSLFAYIISPILIIINLLILGYLMKKFIPKISKIILGGRI